MTSPMVIAQRLDVAARLVGIEHVADLAAHAGASPAQMRFEDLADVHARRHAERVQNDVDMRAVFQERHVFDRHDARNHTLVAVTAGHLVARLDLALHSDEDLDHLHDARRHFIAALDLFDLVHEALFKAATWIRRTGRGALRVRPEPSRLRPRTSTTASGDIRR